MFSSSRSIRFLFAGLLFVSLMSVSGCTSRRLKKFLFPWASSGPIPDGGAHPQGLLCLNRRWETSSAPHVDGS